LNYSLALRQSINDIQVGVKVLQQGFIGLVGAAEEPASSLALYSSLESSSCKSAFIFEAAEQPFFARIGIAVSPVSFL
jgi:hypothetical protein